VPQRYRKRLVAEGGTRSGEPTDQDQIDETEHHREGKPMREVSQRLKPGPHRIGAAYHASEGISTLPDKIETGMGSRRVNRTAPGFVVDDRFTER
jgi:hypothetical protein